ncbi:MAG: NYN domain-containing protein [Candidatus Sumerlaeota bacterium]|nr:NYN domain-containing protein [Candidatus Sumerlaeota bacterium]
MAITRLLGSVFISSFIYLDDSNLWIEGKKVSAVSKGMALDIWEATETRTFDNSFRPDFGRILQIANNEPIKTAKFYGSRPPDADSVWKAAERAGFKLTILERNARNKGKGVDASMIVDIVRDLYTEAQRGDIFILIAGDADYIPAIEAIHNQDYEAHVLFWDHAAAELKKAADRFQSLNTFLDTIRY